MPFSATNSDGTAHFGRRSQNDGRGASDEASDTVRALSPLFSDSRCVVSDASLALPAHSFGGESLRWLLRRSRPCAHRSNSHTPRASRRRCGCSLCCRARRVTPRVRATASGARPARRLCAHAAACRVRRRAPTRCRRSEPAATDAAPNPARSHRPCATPLSCNLKREAAYQSR